MCSMCWLLTFSVDRLEDRCEYLLKEKKELHDKNIGVSLYIYTVLHMHCIVRICALLVGVCVFI